MVAGSSVSIVPLGGSRGVCPSLQSLLLCVQTVGVTTWFS